MSGLILLGAVLLVVALCAGIAALFGFSKSRVHLIITAASAALVLVFCWVIKLVLPSADTLMTLVRNNLGLIGEQFGANAVEITTQALEFAAISPTLVELVLQLVVALALPMLCVVLFAVLFLTAWVVSLLVFAVVAIVRAILRKRAAKRAAKLAAEQAETVEGEAVEVEVTQPKRRRNPVLFRFIAAGMGAVQGVIIVAILLIPLSCYLSIAQPTLNELTAQGVLPADEPVIAQVQDVINELDSAPVLKAYRTLGGKALSDSVMSMKVAGMNVKVSEELSSIITLSQHVLALADNTDFATYGEEEAAIISAIGDSFADSRLLSPIVGDVIFAATDAWLNGESFVGIEAPSLGEGGELLEPMLVAVLEILHDDARQAVLLQADVKTTAELVSILARSGALANLSDTKALMSALGGDTVNTLVTTLGANQSMKRLIPEIMNLGVRAVGQVLNIPANASAVYDQYMTTVTDTLNNVSRLPEQQRLQAISEQLNTAFDTAGMEVDTQVMELYAAAMLHDLVENNTQEITEADVQAFFVLYAQSALQATNALSTRPTFDLLADQKAADPFAGTVYGRMSEQQRQSCAAVAVASLCVQLSALDADDADIVQKATELVTETFTDLLGSDSAVLEQLMSIEITAPVSSKTNECVSSMQSTEDMKKTSTVVTLETLLIDTKAAAENITSETIDMDANAITAIFDTAASLTDVLDGGELNITDLASSVGTILDSLAQTNTFGKDKTADLFTSVLQSETVRDAAKIDMQTATQLAGKATEGEGSYADTMNTVAGAANIMETLSKDGSISQDEMVSLIRSLNAQTAGMIEVYVTPARLVENKIPEKYSLVTSDLIKSLFGYIADSDKSNAEKEAKALNQIMDIALAGKDSKDSKLFSSAPGAGDGKLPTAAESVNTMLDSKAVRHALKDVLTDGSKVTVFDPYELSGKIKPGSKDHTEFVVAVKAYGQAHPEVDQLTLDAVAALFGVNLND